VDYELKFRHDYVILDACCAINLGCSGELTAILRSLPARAAVARYVREQEVRSYDLLPHIERGELIETSEEGESEEQDVVNLAAALGSDGEAVTGAIALARTWAISSDEVRVIQYFRTRYPHLQLLTTPDLVKHWADTAKPPQPAVRGVLTLIRQDGRYAVAGDHPLYRWWREMLAA
jgi:hypothetical protein